MKIAVTGASGFLAGNLIPLLLEQGHVVYAIVRQKKNIHLPQHSNMMVCEGQLNDNQFISEVLKSCDAIVHIAAITRQSHLKLEDYYLVNVEQTLSLCKLSIDAGVKRFVFVSSANTRYHGNHKFQGHENEAYQMPFSGSYYAQSKYLAETELLKLKDEINLSIVNPTFILGPNDQGASSGRLIKTLMKRKIWFCPPGSKNIVHVSDVCRCISIILTQNQTGERYLLAGENYNYHHIYKSIQKQLELNSKIRIIVLPAFVLVALGRIGNLLRKLGLENELSLVNAQILCTKVNYGNEKAKKELGVEFANLDKTLSDAVKWHLGKH
ncbi:MAG TPA: NAD-dependent epimerase/dehydratase family protein [Bacteroidia bacterium]